MVGVVVRVAVGVVVGVGVGVGVAVAVGAGVAVGVGVGVGVAVAVGAVVATAVHMRIYRASSFGGCLKAQIAEKLGFTPLSTDKQMEDLGREGNLHEGEVIDRLTKKGWIISDQQREVNLDLLDEVRVQGHIDGLVLESDPDNVKVTGVLEVKSMGQDPYKNWLKSHWDAPGLVQRYKWQLSVYMLALNLPCRFVVKNRNTGKLDISTIAEPFYSRDDILRRVLLIERLVRLSELPDECDVNNYPCPFYYLEAQTSLELTEDETIETLAIAYDEARLSVSRAEVRKDEARKALLIGLADREQVATEKVVVKYSEYKIPERTVKASVQKRLTVTMKEAENDDNE